MKQTSTQRSQYGRILLHILGVLLLVLCNVSADAQVKPPRPLNIYVSPVQGLNFGAFYQGGTGGTVIIGSDGSRSVTGSIIQASLGFSFSSALFEVDAEPGTLVTILNGSDVTLSGSNGGSITLAIGSASTGSPFIATAIPPSKTSVNIGGTLTIGTPLSAPAGNYSGTFNVMFIQQ